MLLGFEPESPLGLPELLNGTPSVAQPVQGLEYMRDLAKRGCLEVAGYGDRHPREPLEPDSPKNRRVEVVLEFRERLISEAVIAGSRSSCETTR
jgi:hypothetical protein